MNSVMFNMLIAAETVITPTIVIRIILACLMLVAGIATTVLVLLQQSNSDGTAAFSGKSSGDSDTFYGKNKGKRLEYKYKMWTFICAGVLAVCSIVFFLLAL